jgi:hypothetical protein
VIVRYGHLCRFLKVILYCESIIVCFADSTEVPLLYVCAVLLSALFIGLFCSVCTVLQSALFIGLYCSVCFGLKLYLLGKLMGRLQ